MSNEHADLTGTDLLDDPTDNKGTAFTADERRALKLEGLLAPAVEPIDRQLERVIGHLDATPTDLERYIYLVGLCDRNETLFYKTLMSDPARFVPIVYDPTIADACLTFGHMYRRPTRPDVRPSKPTSGPTAKRWSPAACSSPT